MAAPAQELYFFCPSASAAQILRRDAGQIRLDVENRRSVQHIAAANLLGRYPRFSEG
jgi:hypothetical protein